MLEATKQDSFLYEKGIYVAKTIVSRAENDQSSGSCGAKTTPSEDLEVMKGFSVLVDFQMQGAGLVRSTALKSPV